MLSDDQVSQFQRDGLLNAGQVLTDDEVEELSQDLNRVLETGPDGFSASQPKPVLFRDRFSGAYEEDATSEPSLTPVWQIVNIWEASSTFARLIHHPSITTAVGQLTGFNDLQVWHDQIQYKPAGVGGATGWHQDAPKWPSIEPMTPVSAWIPFDDAGMDNGCMWMVPGSHRWGDHDQYLSGLTLEEAEEFGRVSDRFEIPANSPVREIRAVPCPVKRGEVHFHHSLTWHGSPRNHSHRPRRALAIHYMSSQARYTGREHVMQPLIEVPPGGAMRDAGPHFPVVLRDGRPVPEMTSD